MANKEGEGEIITEEQQSFLDKHLKNILAAMGIGEKDDDIVQQCGVMRLRIYKAGEYPNKNAPGTMLKYEAGIELKAGGMSLHVDAQSLAQLKYFMANNNKVNKELTARLEEEKRLMDKIGF